MRLGLLLRPMALDWTLSRRQRVDFGAPPQTWEQCSKEGRIWDFCVVNRCEDGKNPGLWQGNRALEMHVEQGEWI